MRVVLALTICLFAALKPCAGQSSVPDSTLADSTVTRVLRTHDGSTFIGRVVGTDASRIQFRTAAGLLTVAKADVAEIKLVKSSEMKGGEYWFPDPNTTRLFFAPTGRMLEQGAGYFSNSMLFLQNFAGGMSNNVTLAGGFSTLPTGTEQLLYFAPKVGLVSTDRVNIAVGGLAGIVPVDDVASFGVLYGVGTFGDADNSATVGAGWAYYDGKFAEAPTFMFGGSTRISRRTALVTENYFVPDSRESNVLVSYGVRFFGEKLSVDLAFMNSATDPVFPGIPYVAFAVKF